MSATRAEYLALYWDGAPDYEVIRGHVTEGAAFLILCNEGIGLPRPLVMSHRHARWIPASAGAPYDMRLDLCKAGPGAFPVTIVEVS